MPANEAMNWDRADKRWYAMVSDIRYNLSERKAKKAGWSGGWTREESYQFANDWLAGQIKLNEELAIASHPHAPAIKRLTQQSDWAKRHGKPDTADIIDATILQVRQLPADEYQTVKILTTGSEIGEAVWADRIKNEKPVSKERTIAFHVEKYSREKEDAAYKGKRSNSDANTVRRSLNHFVSFAGGSTSVDDINTQLWKQWRLLCEDKMALAKKARKEGKKEGWKPSTAQKYFIDVKAWVKDMHVEDIIKTLPKNFTVKMEFKKWNRETPIYNTEEVKTLFKIRNEKHRLVLLLMANCGMTQVDVSDLTIEQCDLKNGRIIRVRSKTEDEEWGRLVNYKLWDETHRLLKIYIQKKGTKALLTDRGNHWVQDEMIKQPDGSFKRVRSDNFGRLFYDARDKMGLPSTFTPKLFRKASPQLIKSNKDFKELRFWFLGHKEETMTDGAYTPPTQAELDAAVKWLGEQYGFSTSTTT